jgi:DNA-binding transcriptional LysR family regulator
VELRHLKTFLALSEELHFGRTATRLGMTQTAVSRQIGALEQHLGVQLIVRRPRPVLTDAGRLLADKVPPVLDAVDAAVDSARRVADGGGKSGPALLGGTTS